MRLFVRDRRLYTSFFSLLFITAAQMLISLGVNLADNIMLGRYNEFALSGAAIVNQVQFLVQMVSTGVATGVTVLGAQYWGKREIDPIKRIISFGMKLALTIGILFCIVTRIWPAPVLRLLTNQEPVLEQGVIYLRIMCWTYIIYAISNTLVMSLRSVETAFIGTFMSIVAMVVNIFLNYCLIFGNLGFPELGVSGAAIATLASRLVELVIIIVYVLFIDKKLRLSLRDIFGWDMTFAGKYMRVSLPVLCSTSLWGVAQAAQTSILGHIDAVAIAANSIASVVYQFTAILVNCSAGAACVVIGKTIGEGRRDAIKPYSRTIQMLFIIIGVFTAVLLYFVRIPLLNFYNVSGETYDLANTFLLILCVTVIGTAYEFPTASGIIQGGGDTRYVFLVETIFMWGFVIPTSALSAFVFRFPPAVTFMFLKSDQILKCLPNGIRCNRYKWVRDLTQSRPAETEEK